MVSSLVQKLELTKQLSLGLPKRHGLYDPALEKDACGVGFVCDIKGRASRGIIEQAQHMNCCMVHRGGVGYEENSGDGAGILTGLPHKFFSRVVREDLGVELPQTGMYGAGTIFLPRSPTEREHCKNIVAEESQLSEIIFGQLCVPELSHQLAWGIPK